jgi:hypothetical protein
LTLCDLSVASVADLDYWLPQLTDRLVALAYEFGLAADPRPPSHAEAVAIMAGAMNVVPFVPVFFAPVGISTALAMRGIAVNSVTPALDLMLPDQRTVRAAMFVNAKHVHFASPAAEKIQRHPFNTITKPIMGAPPSAVRTAFDLGVLLALADERSLSRYAA